MNIHPITGFLPFSEPIDASALNSLSDLAWMARDEFSVAGVPIQTSRLARQSFFEIPAHDFPGHARAFESACEGAGIDFSLAPYANVAHSVGTALEGLTGGVATGAVAAILLDLATLAAKLDKPPAARLAADYGAEGREHWHLDIPAITRPPCAGCGCHVDALGVMDNDV